jgi:hypothetical protein
MPRPGRRMRHLRHPLAPWNVYDSCVAVLSNLSLLLESVVSGESMGTDVQVELMDVKRVIDTKPQQTRLKRND